MGIYYIILCISQYVWKFLDKTVGEMYIPSCLKVLLFRACIRKLLGVPIELDVSPGVIYNRHN